MKQVMNQMERMMTLFALSVEFQEMTLMVYGLNVMAVNNGMTSNALTTSVFLIVIFVKTVRKYLF